MPCNFEEKLYKAIRVKKWKRLMPAYNHGFTAGVLPVICLSEHITNSRIKF